MNRADGLYTRARELLADLEANGGHLQPQPPRTDGLPAFIVDYAPGADRPRCRAIIDEAKAGLGLLAAMLEIISSRRAA